MLNEERVRSIYVECLELKEQLLPIFTADFSLKDACFDHTSVAQTIAVTQWIALATYQNPKINLKRVMALLLVGGICDCELLDIAIDPIINDVFLSSSWGSNLVDEYLAEDTEEARFAEACRRAEYAWSANKREKYPCIFPDLANLMSTDEPMAIDDTALKFLRATSSIVTEPRAGWKKWNVSTSSLDTIADHQVVAQLLAIVMRFIYDYQLVDIEEVILQLALHNITAAKTGDIHEFQLAEEEKRVLEDKTIKDLLWLLPSSDLLIGEYSEFKERQTEESRFAYFCGKFETDLQAKVYGDTGCVDLDEQDENPAMENETIKSLLNSGCSWSEMWMRYSQLKFGYDENFMIVSEVILRNELI